MIRAQRPTSQDVAQLSGVSRTTVSYVLNRTPNTRVTPATRQRVLDAAESLGYVPSAPAQVLAGGRSRIVLVDLSDIPHGQSIAHAAQLIASELRDEGFIPVVDQLSHRRGDRSELLTLAKAMQPAAIVTAVALTASERATLEAFGASLFIAAYSTREELSTVLASPTALQIRYLASLGHAKIAFAPSPDKDLADIIEARQVAAIGEAHNEGLAPPVLLPPADDPAELAPYLRQLVVDEGVTAVAAYNDEVALMVLNAARIGGLHVPNDLAVIGVDDLSFARLLSPPLSTIGSESAHLLLAVRAALSSTSGTVTHVLPTHKVIQRGTT